MKDIVINIEKKESADRPSITEIKRELPPPDDDGRRIFIGFGGVGKRSGHLPESRVRKIDENGNTVIMDRGKEYEDRITVFWTKSSVR